MLYRSNAFRCSPTPINSFGPRYLVPRWNIRSGDSRRSSMGKPQSPHQLGTSSYSSTTTPSNPPGKNKKPYEGTVQLPKTTFPMHVLPFKNEPIYRDRSTKHLYQWQRQHLTAKVTRHSSDYIVITSNRSSFSTMDHRMPTEIFILATLLIRF